MERDMIRKRGSFLILTAGVAALLSAAAAFRLEGTEIRREEAAVSQQLAGKTEEEKQELQAKAQASLLEEKVADSFRVRNGSAEIGVYYKGSGDCCYVFLPGYVSGDGWEITASGDGMSLTLETEAGSLQTGENGGVMLPSLDWEKAYPLTLTEGEEVLLEGELKFLRSSRLPVLELAMEEEELERIQGEKEALAAGLMTVTGEDGQPLGRMVVEEIRTRGNSTWSLEKKAYQFKLEEKSDLFGMGEAKTWILLANGFDETGLRNAIALDMAKAAGLAFTPEWQFVDLYINGNYQGSYLLCEKVQTGENRVAIRDLEALNQAAGVYEETVVESEDGTLRYVEGAAAGEDISGGYLIERELEERYHEENSGFRLKSGDCFVLKSPAYATREQAAYIRDLMQRIENAVFAEDGIDPESGSRYSELLDVDSFVRKYLVEEVSKNYDGGVTSAFYYKPEDAVSTRLMAGPVWDYDAAFGNCTLDEINSNPAGVTELSDHIFGTDLYTALMDQEAFRTAVFDCYEKVFRPVMQQLLDGGIQDYADRTRASMRMDHLRWEEMNNRYQYYESYEDNIRYLEYFIRKRMEFLDEVWLDGEVYRTVTLQVDGLNWRKYYVKDAALLGELAVPFLNDHLFVGWYRAGTDKKYDPYRPIYEDMLLEARWQTIERG